MTLRLAETCLVLVIAAASAELGDLALWRRSADVYSWVQSFLIGGALGASLLFPLSLAFPQRALKILAALLAGAAAVGLGRRFLGKSKSPSASPARTDALGRPWDPQSLAFLGLTVLGGSIFLVLNWRYSYLWDGFQIWAARAQILFYQGDLLPRFAPDDYMNRALAYPPLIPAWEALVSLLREGFDFEALKPVFLVFYVAMVVTTYGAARAIVSRRLALGATALLCLLPLMSGRSTAGGYADMPLAAYVAGVVYAVVRGGERRGWRSPTPWLIGSLLTVKEEGAVLAAVCCVVAVVLEFTRNSRNAGRSVVSFLVPLALLVGLRVAYVRFLKVPDLTYGPVDLKNIARGFSRLPEVLRLCASELFAVRSWGLFWAAFFIAVFCIFATAAPGSVRAVAAGTLIALGAYTAIFLFTNWPVALHIEQAYPRLLEQIAPAAVIVIVASYNSLSPTPVV